MRRELRFVARHREYRRLEYGPGAADMARLRVHFVEEDPTRAPSSRQDARGVNWNVKFGVRQSEIPTVWCGRWFFARAHT